MISDLLSHGVGTLHGTSVKTYEALAKYLGSRDLTTDEFIRLANEVQKIQKSPSTASYDEVSRYPHSPERHAAKKRGHFFRKNWIKRKSEMRQ